MEAEQRRGDLALELGRERVEAARVELGVADRLGAERVEPRREVAVRAIGVDESRRRGHGCQQLGRRRPAAAAAVGRRWRGRGRRRRGRRPSALRAQLRRSDVDAARSASNSRHSSGTASGFSR